VTRRKSSDLWIHVALAVVAALTLIPFLLTIGNSFRTNAELYKSLVAAPDSWRRAVVLSWYEVTGQQVQLVRQTHSEVAQSRGSSEGRDAVSYVEAMNEVWEDSIGGYTSAWRELRPYMLNTILICVATVVGVVLLGSLSACVFSRYRFPGHKLLFLIVLSFLMIPGILTLVPSFLLVKQLGLLNSYWVTILPYIASGQIMAIFLFKTFFDGLPAELFESARLDGAGHFHLYWHIVLPLSKQVISVVAIINVLGVWNNWLWPFITNSNPEYLTIASGLYLASQAQLSTNLGAMYAAYVIASIPLLILFLYATKPFVAGLTSGAFKA
jgi:ABC-type glycerol-3-phosphate transport system permease component